MPGGWAPEGPAALPYYLSSPCRVRDPEPAQSPDTKQVCPCHPVQNQPLDCRDASLGDLAAVPSACHLRSDTHTPTACLAHHLFSCYAFAHMIPSQCPPACLNSWPLPILFSSKASFTLCFLRKTFPGC